MIRVVRPGGRIVLLTGDVPQLRRQVRALDSELSVLETLPFLLLGVRVAIFVLERR